VNTTGIRSEIQAFNLLHRFARLLPSAWQNFATGMERLCHRHGKTLPPAWQSFAKQMAKT